jgi:integrase
MREYTSFLATQIEPFIAYRKASGNWNEYYEINLHRFENYCAENYPDAYILSQEMVDTWCKQRDAELNNTCRARIYGVVNLILYLRARGKTNVQPPIIPQKERVTYIPHAFTDAELTDFFNACDSLPSKPGTLNVRLRKITVPVFFRLLYSSGIRTTEARFLRTKDVDLQHGVLDIQRSKGGDQHYVALHDSATELLCLYDEAVKGLCPGREYFFPTEKGNNHTAQWVMLNFKKIWQKLSDDYAVAYDFRHHYAVSNINRWICSGFNFDDKLLYLSKSMGHRDTASTKYYYSLVPGFADILEEYTNTDFEDIVPEVDYEKVG